MSQASANDQQNRDSGAQIHRRETRRQIYLPFILGVGLVLGMVLIVALPGDAIWRIRAEAIADWTYTILCLLPLVVCSLPLYMLVIIGIWGMGRIHTSAERPLRRLEIYSGKLAQQIDKGIEYINEKTIAFSSSIAPFEAILSLWDRPVQQHEETPNE